MPESVAIIMRARNEMPQVQQTLGMLKKQTFTGFDFFAIDSGSTDGTLQVLQENYREVSQIPPEQYVPGKVLNEAISRTAHPIIVLLNADAVPLSNDWLEQLLAPLLQDEADAVFCKQVARPEARLIVKYDYERAYRPERMVPGFFSAVACAFKRELWERIAFRDQGYAEDHAWAADCIAAGAHFRFTGDAVVEHSHNYTLKQLFEKRYRQAVTLSETPDLIRQVARCLREITRDVLYACRTFQIQTIPYNMAYRITIHRAVYRGLKDK